MAGWCFVHFIIFDVMKQNLSYPGITVMVFGVYLSLVGLTLLLIPNIFLSLIGVENTVEVWIRLSGLLLMALSVYYIVSALHNLRLIFKVTAYIRCSIPVFFTAFVIADLMDPIMLLFAAIDCAGGLWTLWALHKHA